MFSYKRFSFGFLISFLVLAWFYTRLIPYDYPTALDLMVWYWKIRDQLFRINHYGIIVIPVSILVGIILGHSGKIIDFFRNKS